MDDEMPPQQPEPPPPPPPAPPPQPAAAPPGYAPPPGYTPPGYGSAPPPPPPAYGAPGYGQPAYGAPGYGNEAPRTEGMAVAAFVVAIVGLFVCGVVSGVVALVLAHQAQQKIAVSGGRLTGSGLVTAARVIAIISIVLSIAGFAILLAAD